MGCQRLLAFETSGKSGSVALATRSSDGSMSLDEETLDPQWGSARTLAPAIERVLKRAGVEPQMIDAVAAIQGPGSFTGLRVGVATAKTMAWALNIPLIAVDMLDCVAHQVLRSTETLHDPVSCKLIVVADAYRGQLFSAEYRCHESSVSVIRPTAVEDIESLMDRWTGAGEAFVVAGPGADRLRKWLQSQLSTSAQSLVTILDIKESIPMAATVAKLGWERWERGEIEDVMGFFPKYYRSSAAEEKAGR
ncbi:MAG: tRNA (adenosine(37)-N6)-threonylcarbamoyltransferase complex dimerization subunit type 1 TsaB [Pirellula sp.]|jgi:tRNA threonylcarbamoyladenosine biosynthesis protein TsaB|nr:tRNA (adenosine(37)-N6)-threonylcarbamoyltransferase complex dimerization subunit type 1 TsaB [Pirellula sp.]